MDPLHPLVPIQPASPTPPDYTRVQRVERDQQREPAPDWQQSPDQDGEDEEREAQFDDSYDPDWSDPAAAETGYNDHGVATEAPGANNHPAPETRRRWDPHRQGERRSQPRRADDPEDENPGPHIDIVA